MLSTSVPAGGLPYQFIDDGPISFVATEGSSSLAVYAPDLELLRIAVAAIRPQLLTQLEDEIAHPSTHQPKVTPETPTE